MKGSDTGLFLTIREGHQSNGDVYYHVYIDTVKNVSVQKLQFNNKTPRTCLYDSVQDFYNEMSVNIMLRGGPFDFWVDMVFVKTIV